MCNKITRLYRIITLHFTTIIQQTAHIGNDRFTTTFCKYIYIYTYIYLYISQTNHKLNKLSILDAVFLDPLFSHQVWKPLPLLQRFLRGFGALLLDPEENPGGGVDCSLDKKLGWRLGPDILGKNSGRCRCIQRCLNRDYMYDIFPIFLMYFSCFTKYIYIYVYIYIFEIFQYVRTYVCMYVKIWCMHVMLIEVNECNEI